MDKGLIDKIAGQYMRRSLCIILAIALLQLAVLAGTAYMSQSTVSSIVIGVLFSFVSVKSYQMAWRSLVTTATALTKFYIAAPVIRMMAAVVVMLTFYAVHRGDVSPEGMPLIRSVMLGFTVIFFSYYFILMVFDSIYFSQVEKRNK